MSNNNTVLLLGIAFLSYIFYQNNYLTLENMAGNSNNVSANDIVSSNGNLYLKNAKEGSLFAITANWCSHCVQLKKNITASGIKNYYLYDATNNSDPTVKNTLTLMGVSSFPTVFVVGANGMLIDYKGGREVHNLKSNFT